MCAAAQGTASAAPGEAEERRLAELRARIESLRVRVEGQEASRREARDALRDSERAISAVNRTLAQLDREERNLRDRAKGLVERRRTLEHTLAEQQATLGRVLAARYATGVPDTVRIVLSGDDLADVARRLHYFAHVARAANELIGAARRSIAELKQLRQQALDQAARLASIEAERRADRARLSGQRLERQRILARLGGELRASRRRMKVMVADEARLARLVEEIGKVLASESPGDNDRVQNVAPMSAVGGSFSRLRGKLRLPVRGELAGRFGGPGRPGGAGAKGVFINAAEGQPVRAVAPGQVVYADWMRGFGNLLIVDHGEAYMSIYANNEALLKQVGELVAAGETIATVGASGGNEETGLYFELRHLGIAFDPLQWITLR